MAAKTPRSRKNNHAQNNPQQQKRELIDSLELLRGVRQNPVATDHDQPESFSSSDTERLSREMDELRGELRASQSANSLLENDLRKMEQKTLETIAENGSLKRMLDQAGMECCEQAAFDNDEREKILQELQQSRNDHLMLTQALIDSENEIARLTRTLEKLSRKLCA